MTPHCNSYSPLLGDPQSSHDESAVGVYGRNMRNRLRPAAVSNACGSAASPVWTHRPPTARIAYGPRLWATLECWGIDMVDSNSHGNVHKSLTKHFKMNHENFWTSRVWITQKTSLILSKVLEWLGATDSISNPMPATAEDPSLIDANFFEPKLVQNDPLHIVNIWGFWILDFGILGFWWFWILDFGDFGDFGFWILGFWGGPGDVPLGNLATVPGGQRLESPGLPGPLQNQLYLIELGQGSKLNIFSKVRTLQNHRKTLTSNPEVRTLQNHRKT